MTSSRLKDKSGTSMAKNVGKLKKNTYLCDVEKMIYIRRSGYEQLISQQAELVELRLLV
jgi:hypothetical protein